LTRGRRQRHSLVHPIGERVQDESGNLGLQVCTGPDGDYAASELLTGVDVAREKILCARAEAR